MSQITKTLTLDKVRQLVDLNGELTNFVARFIITPKTDAPYEYTIASQTMLDNAETLNFLPAKGPVQKEFTIEEDLYQNHFLVLRSTSPHEVDVIVQRQPLPTKVVPNEAAAAQAVVVAPPQVEPPFYKQLWFQLAMACLAAAAVYYIYSKYFSKKTEKTESAPIVDPVAKKYSFVPTAYPRQTSFNLASPAPVVSAPAPIPEPIFEPPTSIAPVPVPTVSTPAVSTPAPVPAPAPAPIVSTPTPAPAPAPVAVEPTSSAPKASSPKDFTSMLLKKLKNAAPAPSR